MIRYLLLGVILLVIWLVVVPADVSWRESVDAVVTRGEEWLADVQEYVDGGVPSPIVATATVAFVIDGDTLELEDGERVRLLGIDTPEREECYYNESRLYLAEAVAGKVVRLERDVTDRDDYGRLLRHVFLPSEVGERHLNYELVAEGYAVVLPIPPDRAYREEFQAAEATAEAAGLGRYTVCAVE